MRFLMAALSSMTRWKKGSMPRLIGELLSAYPLERQQNLIYWGSASAYGEVRARASGISGRLMTRWDMVACRNAILRRLALGPLPAPCRGATIIIPASALHHWYVRLTLGWPGRFIAKVHRIGSQIVIATDSADEAAALRRLGIDGIMTDRIKIVGPRLK